MYAQYADLLIAQLITVAWLLRGPSDALFGYANRGGGWSIYGNWADSVSLHMMHKNFITTLLLFQRKIVIKPSKRSLGTKGTEVERWQSGSMHWFWKPTWLKSHRGFESLPLLKKIV